MSFRYVESVVKRSCISITNVLSVSAYNTIMTKPIVKKFCWKNKCHFLPNKKFRLVLSHISIFVRNASGWHKQDDPSTPCHMHHSQSFDKIDTFLKPVLNILILFSLIVGWSEGVIKEGTGILHQIYRFRGVV